jgi:histidine ammonia-lyase
MNENSVGVNGALRRSVSAHTSVSHRPRLNRTMILDGRLGCLELHHAATHAVEIQLAPALLTEVERNRAVLEAAIAQGTRVYGVTTGVGALMVEEVALAEASEAQTDLLRSHAAGWGEPLPREVVRASLIVRLNGMLQGFSGVRPIVLHRIADLLNHGLIPIIPRYGSLGASGDLAPSAHAFLPLIGEGEVADDAGKRLTGAQALERLRVPPLRLSHKEGLALINGTQFMAAIAALVSVRAGDVLETADAAAAMSAEALRGCTSSFDPRIHQLRGTTGQIRSADNIRKLTKLSELLVDNLHGLQDPYSIRCAPQVHGAAREAAMFFDRIAEAEINAVTDNPLVFTESPQIISGGNFHGQSIALAFDTLRIALADLASISERRLFTLLSPATNRGLPAFLGDGRSGSSGYMLAQYTSAALLSSLRTLAHPVSIDSVPTSGGQEDHVSMGMTAALMALETLDKCEAVLGIELLCAAQGLDGRSGRPGVGTSDIHRLLRAQIPMLTRDRPPANDIDVAARLVASGQVAQIVRHCEFGD